MEDRILKDLDIADWKLNDKRSIQRSNGKGLTSRK